MVVLSIIVYVITFLVTYTLVVYTGYKLFIERKGGKDGKSKW